MNMNILQTTFLLFATVFLVSATPNTPRLTWKREFDPHDVPTFGIVRGQGKHLNSNGTEVCEGTTDDDGHPVDIPCDCPPPWDEFVKVSFSEN
jgi:hypothetical protein